MTEVLLDLFGEQEQTLETLCQYTEIISEKYEEISLAKGIDAIEIESAESKPCEEQADLSDEQKVEKLKSNRQYILNSKNCVVSIPAPNKRCSCGSKKTYKKCSCSNRDRTRTRDFLENAGKQKQPTSGQSQSSATGSVLISV